MECMITCPCHMNEQQYVVDTVQNSKSNTGILYYTV